MTTPARPARHSISHYIKTTAWGLLILSLNSCALLTPLPESIENYPEDFAQFLNSGNHYQSYDDLVYFLAANGIDDTVPVWQLLQQGTDWRRHKLQKYAIPPRENWDDMVNTLIFLKYDLMPYIGPVEVLSGFRTPTYNRVAGGAAKSRHLDFSALDLRPVNEIKRSQLRGILTERWTNIGKQYNLGLGLYSGSRFHIDTGGHRRW